MKDGNPRLALFSARGSSSFSPLQCESLEAAFDVDYFEALEPLEESAFESALQCARAAAITPRALPRDLSPDFWSKLPALEVVFLPTTGTEWFPVEAVEKCGISVRNLPGYSGQSTAEFAWGLVLALQRHIVAANQRVLFGKSPSLLGRDLCGRRLGVVGCGDVGRRVAKFGEAFGMKVSVFDLKPIEAFSQTSLSAIFEECDVISIHLPLTALTRKLFDSQLFARTRPGLLVVNTARPALIGFDLIRAMLEEGRVAGYALDQGYFPREDILELARHPRVLAVPHISWYTTDSIEREMTLWVEMMTLHHFESATSETRLDQGAELI